MQPLCWRWRGILLVYIPFFLELLGGSLSPSSLGAWHRAALRGLPLSSVRGCSFPSITRSYAFPLPKGVKSSLPLILPLTLPFPCRIPPAAEQLIQEVKGGHLQVVCGRALFFAELELGLHKSCDFGSVTELSQSMLCFCQPPDARSSVHTLMYCLPVLTDDFI